MPGDFDFCPICRRSRTLKHPLCDECLEVVATDGHLDLSVEEMVIKVAERAWNFAGALISAERDKRTAPLPIGARSNPMKMRRRR